LFISVKASLIRNKIGNRTSSHLVKEPKHSTVGLWPWLLHCFPRLLDWQRCLYYVYLRCIFRISQRIA